MKTILAENAEKYSELICEAKEKTDNIKQMEDMLKNPETIEVVALAFADNKEIGYGNCLGKHMNTHDRQEQIECLTFFIQFTKRQLERINQQISRLLLEVENNKESDREQRN